MYTKTQASAFAVTALLAYLVATIENSAAFAKQLKFRIPGQDFELSLPKVQIVMIGILLVIASRLYFQAWAVDERFLIIRLKTDTGLPKWRIWTEFMIRITWLMLTMYFPTVLANGHIIVQDQSLSWQLYLMIIFGLIFIWDVLLGKFIIALNRVDQTVRPSRLHWFWLGSDLLLFVLTFLNFIATFDETGWKWILYFFVLGIMSQICFVQICVFSWDILKHTVKFELEKRSRLPKFVAMALNQMRHLLAP